MSRGKVVAWRVSNTGKHWELRKTEPRGWRYIQPLVLQSDLAAAMLRAKELEARAEALEALLDEVRCCFTRDDDLPDELLPRIDAAIAAPKGGVVA